MPSPEELSMDCGLQCDICGASVNFGDDYIAHLKIEHKVIKNYTHFLNKAKENIKSQGSKRKADVITLDEDDNSIDDGAEEVPDNPAQIDEAVKEKLQSTVQNIMDELLNPLREIIDGKVPLDSEIRANDYTNDDVAYEAKIWECFDSLKLIVNEIEFPEELLKALVTQKKKKEEEDETLKETSSTDSTVPAVDKFKLPSPPQQQRRKAARTTSAVQGRDQSGSGPRAISRPSDKAASVPGAGPLLPVRSDNSSRSGASSSNSSARRTTVYCCPLDRCTFAIDKEGMVGGAAAQHLKLEHGVTGEVMKKAEKGKYKFRKVKRETTT